MTKNLSISNILIFICVIVSIFAFNFEGLYIFGMNDFFINQGKYEYFIIQIFLSNFIHGDIIHLFSNILILFLFGNTLEFYTGRKRFLIFFFVTAVFNSIALLFLSSGNTVGISGFGMAILTYYVLELYNRNSPDYKSGLLFIFINIAIGLAPGISLVGHLFGSIIGVIYFYINFYFTKKTRDFL